MCLVGTLLGTFTVLCITLPMSRTEDSTLDASTFGKNESLDLVLKMENGVELHLKATSNYYGSCPELKQDVEKYGRDSFRELY